MYRSFEDLEWNKERRTYGSTYRFRYVTHDDGGETAKNKLRDAGIPLGENTVPYGEDQEIAIEVNVSDRWVEILSGREIDELF